MVILRSVLIPSNTLARRTDSAVGAILASVDWSLSAVGPRRTPVGGLVGWLGRSAPSGGTWAVALQQLADGGDVAGHGGTLQLSSNSGAARSFSRAARSRTPAEGIRAVAHQAAVLRTSLDG